MKRFLTAGLLALALIAASQQRAAAHPNGPFGFTVGGAGSLSLYVAPIFGGVGCADGGGPYYPGYSHPGCGKKRGMLPAYAYLPPDPGFYGYPYPYPPPAAPAPGNGNGNGNGSNGNGNTQSAAPGQGYPTTGAAYYPPAGYGGYDGYGYGAFPYAPGSYYGQ